MGGAWNFGDSESIVHDTVTADTRPYTFIETGRRYMKKNTRVNPNVHHGL